jgi:hypothetical protein
MLLHSMLVSPMKGTNINVNYKFSFVNMYEMKVYFIYGTVPTV